VVAQVAGEVAVGVVVVVVVVVVAIAVILVDAAIIGKRIGIIPSKQTPRRCTISCNGPRRVSPIPIQIETTRKAIRQVPVLRRVNLVACFGIMILLLISVHYRGRHGQSVGFSRKQC